MGGCFGLGFFFWGGGVSLFFCWLFGGFFNNISVRINK